MSGDDVAGVEVAEDGVVDAGAGSDVEGAGEEQTTTGSSPRMTGVLIIEILVILKTFFDMCNN
jgi:hypothetical protein